MRINTFANARRHFIRVGIGSIEFVGVIAVKLISARNLVNADVIGKSDDTALKSCLCY